MNARRTGVFALAALGVCGFFVACSKEEPKPPPPAKAPAAASKVEIISAPAEGEVQAIVEPEIRRAKEEGRKLLVYVGASWCEPCRRFHDAALAGELDSAFGDLRLIEFDLDRDHDRLGRAGYRSRLIPLFALPREDGMASGAQIEGSIKGEGAVGQIAPRLKRLVEERKGD